MFRDNAQLQTDMRLTLRNAYLLAPYAEQDGAAGLEALRERLLRPLIAPAPQSTAYFAGATNTTQPLARIGERSIDWPRKRALWQTMRDVPEDQFHGGKANLVDMGYIYDVRTRGNDVRVLMTMPHKGRPKFNFLANPLRARLEQLADISSVVVELTWQPAWSPNRLTDAGRQMMGLDD